MHCEAHGLYEPVHVAFLRKADPMSGTYWEREQYHYGVRGQIVSGDFWRYTEFSMHFPPIHIRSHDLDRTAGWVMKVKQKLERSRPTVSVFNDQGFGFRIKLPGKLYSSANDVIEMITKTYRIVGSELSSLQMRTPPVVYVDREVKVMVQPDIMDVLKKDNAESLKRLGDWRPDLPNYYNVVDIMERMNAEEIREAGADAGCDAVAGSVSPCGTVRQVR